MPFFPADQLADEQLRPGVTVLLSELGLADRAVERFDGGSLPVYAVGGDLVLKLFPPVHRDETGTEATVLRLLHGELPIPPRVWKQPASSTAGVTC